MKTKSIIDKFILFILIFLYIYNIGVVFFPGSLKTRMIIGIIGFLFIIKKKYVDKDFFIISILYFFFITYTLFIIILNLTNGSDLREFTFSHLYI